MLNEKRDKLITDVLRGPWPKDRCGVCGWMFDEGKDGCTKDGCSMRPLPLKRADRPIDLSTPSGFFWTWDKLWEKRLAIKFMKYYSIKHLGEPEPGFMPFELLNINLCMNALAGFLESKCLKK